MGVTINFEDAMLIIGIIAALIMYHVFGFEKLLEKILSFVVSVTIFYFVAEKIRKRMRD